MAYGPQMIGADRGMTGAQFNTNGAAAAGQEESPLQRDIKGIRQALDRLEGMLGTLLAKLSPVTLAEAPCNPCETQSVQPVRSAYGDNLREHEFRIHALADIVESLRNRLEV